MAQNQQKNQPNGEDAKPRDQRGVNEETQSVTDPSPVAKADETSEPVPNDAKLDQPPLRSPRAPEKLATSLGKGAGAHEPPDPEKYDEMGRPRS